MPPLYAPDRGALPYTLYRSRRREKKWDVYIPTNRGQKKVSYGQAGASDYTQHKDRERRGRYRARHVNDRLDDPYAPGFWSWHALWGASSDSQVAFRAAVARAKKLLRV
jgi:hypothetical protein